jgi:hypothetical protein
VKQIKNESRTGCPYGGPFFFSMYANDDSPVTVEYLLDFCGFRAGGDRACHAIKYGAHALV